MLPLLILLLVLPFVSSQSGPDADGDGIADKYDYCSGTGAVDLPLYTNQNKYIGCSCEQIVDVLGDGVYCVDLFCQPGRPFDIQKRITSSRATDCGPDYCVDSDYYAFPDPAYVKCVNGMPEKLDCTPEITKEYEGCIDGSVPQGPFEQQTGTEQINIEDAPEIKEQHASMYDAILSDIRLKKFVAGISRSEFLAQTSRFNEFTDIQQAKGFKELPVGGSVATVTEFEVLVNPLSENKIDSATVFVRLTGDDSLKLSELVFNINPSDVSESARTMVWELKDPGNIDLVIRANRPTAAQMDVAVIGAVDVSYKYLQWWPLLLIPFIAYGAYWWIRKDRKKSVYK